MSDFPLATNKPRRRAKKPRLSADVEVTSQVIPPPTVRSASIRSYAAGSSPNDSQGYSSASLTSTLTSAPPGTEPSQVQTEPKTTVSPQPAIPSPVIPCFCAQCRQRPAHPLTPISDLRGLYSMPTDPSVPSTVLPAPSSEQPPPWPSQHSSPDNNSNNESHTQAVLHGHIFEIVASILATSQLNYQQQAEVASGVADQLSRTYPLPATAVAPRPRVQIVAQLPPSPTSPTLPLLQVPILQTLTPPESPNVLAIELGVDTGASCCVPVDFAPAQEPKWSDFCHTIPASPTMSTISSIETDWKPSGTNWDGEEWAQGVGESGMRHISSLQLDFAL